LLRLLRSVRGTEPEYQRVRFDGGDRGSSGPKVNVRQSTLMTQSGFRLRRASALSGGFSRRVLLRQCIGPRMGGTTQTFLQLCILQEIRKQ
jgi:hypothetical protein